jgi:Tfp pilus assembly protein PilO
MIHVLVLGPLNRSIKKLDSELNKKRNTYEFAQNAAREESRKKILKQIEDLRKKLNSFVTDFEDSANLTFDISQIAREKNVASLNVENKNKLTTTDETDSTNISESHINISFTTGFNQFAAFMNALERHQPVLFVNEFRLSRSNHNKSAYQITIDVAALIRKQQDDRNTTAKSSQQASDEKI